ncbi:MAG: CAP domain-containing protein [Gordonia sp. (in: high G+C Gram-positive bacteria)]|uniref:CAP domain-containing protein n=1 Tax=Gordonia sp. (in: high G+C Gram-positive bacteria) TaxID=84139 RepID=UPI0039E5B6D3
MRFTTVRTALIFAMTLMLGVLTLLVAPVSPAEAASTATMENQLFSLTNQTRKSHGVPAVSANACLKNYARSHAAAMARNDPPRNKNPRIWHQNLNPILSGCRMTMVGENVAAGYSTAAQAHNGWWNSPGHRKNMMNRQFNRLGAGVALSRNGRYYYVTVYGRQ